MSDTEQKKAVVLLSGGLDSATALAIAREEGFQCHALTIRYGQRHEAELTAAKKVAAALGAEGHRFVDVDLTAFGGSALTDDIPVPKHRSGEEIAAGIPVTYVPARNTIFLALALAQTEVLDARDIFIGVTAVDYSGYPDCRPDFIHAFTRVANLATRAGVEGARPFHIHTPLIDLTKAEIIRRGNDLGIDYGLTMSCYDPTPAGEHCGACDACILRRKGFAQAGISDPTHYDKAA